MRYILFVILFLGIFSVSQAQKRLSAPINKAALNNDDNVLIYKFTIPGSDLSWSRMFMNNNRLVVTYSRKDSANVVTTLNSYLNFRKWERTDKQVPMRDSIHDQSVLHPTIYGTETYPIYVFYGDSVLYYSYLETKNSEWIGNRKVAVLLGQNNSMIGVISAMTNDSYAIFNSQCEEGQNHIIKAHSEDNGHNWSMVTTAVKHNMKELKGWCVASHSKKPHISYMLLTDFSNAPYYSQTIDGGITWSYPKRISTALAGSDYKMTITNGYVVVAFRKLTDNKLADNNDMMLWHGSLQEFVSDQKKGNLMKIVDNEPDSSRELDFTVEDICYYKSRHYLVLIKSFADDDSSLQIHLIRRTKN